MSSAPTIGAGRVVERLAATAAQAGIWTGQRLDPGNPAYAPAEYLLLRGRLDTAAFETALRRTVAEAPALLTRFPDQYTQLVDPATDWRLTRLRLPTHAEAERWMRADLATPLDPRTGPLFSTALIDLGAETHLWYLRIHHIAADGYAFAMLAARVAEHYTAAVTGADPGRGFAPLAPVVDEDRAYRGSPREAADREFWLAYLADAPVPVTLAEPAPLAHSTLRHRVRLPEPAGAGGIHWGHRVLAAVAVLLHRRTGAEEVVLGLPVAGRLGSATLRVPCMAMNIVPLRVPVAPTVTLAELAGGVAGAIRATGRHHRYRYEQLRRDLGLVGGDRRLFGPVVNVMPFDYRPRWSGLSVSSHNLGAGPVDDLSFAVADRGDGPVLDLEANPNAYRAADLAAVAAELVELLGADPAAVTAAPVTMVDGGPPPDPVVDVVAAIERVAGTDPHRVAVVEPGVGEIGYARLLAEADRVAGRLAALGAGPGTVVAVLLPRGIAAVTAILGVLRCGAAYLPLDPTGPAERRAAVLADVRPGALIAVDGIGALPGAVDRAPDLAYVIHTSGSTGTPNGVAVGRGALARFVAAATDRYAITAADRVLQFAPPHFDASVEEIFLTLTVGATLVVRTDAMLDSMAAFVSGCAELRVSVLDLPTAFWHELAWAELPLPPSVHTVIIGGEAALAERVARWHRVVGPSVRLLNTYGPTEATVVATVAELTGAGGDVPIGRPLPGVRCAVAGGELYLLGGCLADGYLDRPELTAARFGRLAGERAYRTGDLVRIGSDGQLYHLGRADDQFKISGYRVEPTEIESVLAGHPGVVEVAVVGQRTPQGVPRLVGFVVGEVDERELRGYAAAALPAATVPTVFVPVPRLPRTGSGKIDRAELRRLAADLAGPANGPAVDSAGGPVGYSTDGSTDGSTRRLTAAERAVAAAWREVLGPRAFGPDDDFFAVGGQSLQTIALANRLGIAVRTVFANPTVAALARTLDAPTADGSTVDTVSTLDDVTAAEQSYLADAVLPAGIGPRPHRPTGRLLLTGATGFVGAHLLVELLHRYAGRVVCLVRAEDPAGGLARLVEAAERQGLPVDLDRVDVVTGSVAEGYQGPDVDAVLHCAASVSVVRDYPSMRATNVTGTRRLLELGVPLHHVSTLAVATAPGFVPAHPGLRDGYQRSKWVAEDLVRQAGERGLPAAVHRLGRVVGARDTGYVNPADLVWRILRAGIPRRVLPDLDLTEPWTPVDWVAATVVSRLLAGATGVDNLTPVANVQFGQVVDWVRRYGFDVAVLPLPEWCARVRADADPGDRATLAFFDRASDGGTPPAGGAPAGNWPAGTGPAVDEDLMRRYLDHAVASGLLPNGPQ